MDFDFLTEKEIREIILEANFVVEKEIYSSTYYRKGKTRNIIYKGRFEGKKAILKIWKDPREIYEPVMLKDFLKNNKSEILIAPKLYNYKMHSDHFGWMIEECIDTSKNIFEDLPGNLEREEFIKVFKEYKSVWPKEPIMKVLKDNNVVECGIRHLKKWRKIAEDKNWLKKESYELCDEVGDVMKKFGNNYNLIWVHGHFKAKEIFKINNKYYLTDFAHCSWQPEFMEGPFIVWAIILGLGEAISYDQALKESLEWKKLFVDNKFTDEMGFNLGILGRCCGAILADIGGSDYYVDKKERLLNIWTSLLKYYLNNTNH